MLTLKSSFNYASFCVNHPNYSYRVQERMLGRLSPKHKKKQVVFCHPTLGFFRHV